MWKGRLDNIHLDAAGGTLCTQTMRKEDPMGMFVVHVCVSDDLTDRCIHIKHMCCTSII